MGFKQEWKSIVLHGLPLCSACPVVIYSLRLLMKRYASSKRPKHRVPKDLRCFGNTERVWLLRLCLAPSRQYRINCSQFLVIENVRSPTSNLCGRLIEHFLPLWLVNQISWFDCLRSSFVAVMSWRQFGISDAYNSPIENLLLMFNVR